MEHKNANNVTDIDLYNGFVWIQKDGKAVSMYYGKKIVWDVVTGVEESEKWHQYTKIGYAMLAATYSAEALAEMEVSRVKILVEPDGVRPFYINAECSDTHHTVIEKLRKLHEGVNPVQDLLNNIDDGIDLNNEGGY